MDLRSADETARLIKMVDETRDDDLYADAMKRLIWSVHLMVLETDPPELTDEEVAEVLSDLEIV